MISFRSAAQGALLCALAMTPLAGCDLSSAGDRPADLQVLFSGSMDGFLEPCGCVAGRFGGVDRVAAWIERERAERPDALFFDLGDLYLDSVKETPDVLRQLPLKADAMLDVWGTLGADAMAVGCLDLHLGIETLGELADKHGVPLLCANLFHQESGERPFPAYRIVERNGLKVGVFAVLSSRLKHPRIEGPEMVHVARIAEEAGYEVRDFISEAERAVEDLRDQVDLVIGLAHIGTKRALQLAREVEGIDMLLTLHPDEEIAEATMEVEGVVISHLAVKGGRGGKIQLWVEDPEALADPGQHLTNWSAEALLAQEAEVVYSTLNNLQGREAVIGSQEYARQKWANESARDRGIDRLSAMETAPLVNRFASTHVPMYPGIGRSEAALARIDTYHQDLSELWGAPRALDPPPNQRFAGPQACASCHPSQYEFWKATRHSRAYQSLKVTNQHLDAECAKCHTVGYRQFAGWQAPSAAVGFENVQCAACHGPGADHANGNSRNLFGRNFSHAPSACANCHNKQHDPDFGDKQEEKLAAVSCPPLPAPGQGSPAFIAHLRSQVEPLMQREQIPWERIALNLQGAGDFEESLEASERWIESGGGPNAVLHRAQLLIRLERSEEALEPLAELVQETRANPIPVAWQFYAESLLLNERPREAIDAAIEAYSLDPSSPKSVELLARGALAIGERLEALDALRTHCAAHPENEPILRPLMNEISGLAEPR